ncbi:MAG: bifunctional (p)ppGpp synthetase/guanosine-3',5'-bis(diphosphate) 3'-pyrophosphohydrolase, partial [Asticcacaulis sp.]|nr:bifunctional (p)ppGpp synthetase/guanosine-3',5'-bis(diphosphate) 3'-pyrophosphohydrolase [Asticcacaulis sp.]
MTTDTAKLIAAVHFAADKHRYQRRKDTDATPYINHPVALAHILVDEGGIEDTDVLCAALLHDTVEDTDTTPEEIAARFGPRIAAIVMEVTDDKSLPGAARKQAQIDHAPHISLEAKLVKLADKISNL